MKEIHQTINYSLYYPLAPGSVHPQLGILIRALQSITAFCVLEFFQTFMEETAESTQNSQYVKHNTNGPCTTPMQVNGDVNKFQSRLGYIHDSV